MTVKWLLFILFINCGCMTAGGNSASGLNDSLISLDIEEIVITAGRFNTLKSNTPEAISLIRSSSLQPYQLRTTPEALVEMPGVFVQKTNHGGGSPFIRGLTGNQTLLMIDGIRLSNSTMRYGPNQYLNTVDFFGIDRMEVLRGGGSVQYGSDAMGGTFQVFTREAKMTEKDAWGAGLITRVSTQGLEKSLRAGVNYSNRNHSFLTGLTLRKFGDLVGGKNTGKQIPSGYNEIDFDVKGRILLTKSSFLTMLYQNVHQQDVPLYHKILLENYAVHTTDPQKRELAYIRWGHKLNNPFMKSVTLTVSHQQNTEKRISRKNDSQLERTENDRVRSLGFSGELILADRNVWTGNLGFDVYSDRVNSTRSDKDLSTGMEVQKRGLYPDDSHMSSMAVFMVHQLMYRKWILTAGARINSFLIDVPGEASERTRISPLAMVGNAGVLRKLTARLDWMGSVNTGFRAPNIDDLGSLGIVDFRFEVPNPGLKPERTFQLQTGIRYNSSRFRGETYIYRTGLYDLIARVRQEDQFAEGYPLYKKENLEKACIMGAESVIDITLLPSLILNGSVTYTYGQNVTNEEPMRRIPPLFGRLATTYNIDQWIFNLEWLAAARQNRLAQGDKDDNRIPDGGTPGWNIINVNSGYAWQFIRVDLSLKNLLNKDYRYHGSGINGYGRSLFLTLSLNI